MDIESDPKSIETSSPFPRSRWGRLLYGLFVTILPVFSFWMVHVVKPDWQSGNLSDYAILFLFPQASLLVLPLLTYSIICYLLLLINASRFAPLFLIRLGVYTGVLLALHYSVAILLALEPSPWLFVLIIVWISPLILSHVYPWALKKWNLKLLGRFFVGLVGILALINMIVSRNIFSPFFTILVLLVLVAPFWSFLLAVRTAVWLLKNHESKLTTLSGLGVGVWVIAYLGALRFNILKMYELYAALPPTPPDCYIATAAAQGHPQIVRSWPVRLKSGGLLQVNSQLQHFKFFEIAMMAVSPKLHSRVRKIYDVLGKKLAVHIRNPLLADVAFLVLLPVEWISFRMLKLFVPEIEVISKKIYYSSFIGDNSG
jgi:hypothetical protein